MVGTVYLLYTYRFRLAFCRALWDGSSGVRAQTDRQTDRHTDRQTDRQTDRLVEMIMSGGGGCTGRQGGFQSAKLNSIGALFI